ncbi:MAG: ATP-binding protein [Burkholderiales bacterium]
MSANQQVMHNSLVRTAKTSVRNKLMLMVLATTLVALLLASATMITYELRTYHETRVNELMSQADLLGRASAPALAFDDPKAARENLSLLNVAPGITAAAIYTAKGALFADYTRANAAGIKVPQHPQAGGYQIDGDQILVYQTIEDNNELLGTVYMSARYELMDRLKSYLSILVAVMAISMLGALLMTAWLQAIISKPILEIAEVASQVVTRRDFSLRARKTTDDEIGYLVDAFNDMLAEIGLRAQALEESNRALQQEMSERREAEKALLAADQRKDEFLATLAHELRNPLAPLGNALEILRGSIGDPAKLNAARDLMERQLRQLVRLVNDLLDISRITTGKMVLKKEPVELHDIVNSAVEAAAPLMEARQHRLDVKLPAGRVTLLADLTRLAQVFMNLLNNAAKFTDPGGAITFAAEVKDGDLVVTVTDSGIGINPKMLTVVFDMFAQADRSLERAQAGLGVGLSLVKHLVEMHGGTIVARSDGLGRGSQFIIRLPSVMQLAATPVAPDGAVEEGAPVAKRRILLADDNIDFVESLAMLLQALGHDVRVAHDGLAALEAAAKFRPDVAFLDIGLPGLNGYELARRLHAAPATKNTALIAVTGWGQDDDRRRAREAGFVHHLVKPVELEAIEQVLRDVQTP